MGLEESASAGAVTFGTEEEENREIGIEIIADLMSQSAKEFAFLEIWTVVDNVRRNAEFTHEYLDWLFALRQRVMEC